jgi:hypothetical protein
MANKSTLIKHYAEANGVSDVDFTTDVRLVDYSDGTGVHIEHWGLSISQPTDEQLASYETAANKEEANNQVRSTRKTLYGDIGDQLDEIYSDIDAWKIRIKSIKDSNPKQ